MDVHVLPSQVHVEMTDDGDQVHIDRTRCPCPTIRPNGPRPGTGLAVLGQLIYRRSDRNHWILESRTFV